MNILALSGSLRAASVNSALLRVACRVAPLGVTVETLEGLGDLPLFNPDLETEPPDLVRRFRARVAQSDALLIASPEYAHGITGTIKNALDWLVSFEPFAGKMVALLNASGRAHHADAALREILRTMAAILVEPASITIPLPGSSLDEEAIAALPGVAASLRKSLTDLHEALAVQRIVPRLLIG